MKPFKKTVHKLLQNFCILLICIFNMFVISKAMAQTSDSFTTDPFMQTDPSSGGDPFLEQDPFMQQYPDYDDSQNINNKINNFGIPQQNELPQEEAAPTPLDNTNPNIPQIQNNQYIDESFIPQGFEERIQQEAVQQRVIMSDERQNMIPNVAYGVGTGFIIGGWLAVLTANTRRDTLASIGSGIVLGGVVGALIGSRAIILPDPNIPADPALGKVDRPMTFAWNFQF